MFKMNDEKSCAEIVERANVGLKVKICNSALQCSSAAQLDNDSDAYDSVISMKTEKLLRVYIRIRMWKSWTTKGLEFETKKLSSVCLIITY